MNDLLAFRALCAFCLFLALVIVGSIGACSAPPPVGNEPDVKIRVVHPEPGVTCYLTGVYLGSAISCLER